jgi:hypothetical protein
MVKHDPVNHYCSLIQETISEGGSEIKEPRAGITSDMAGRWTIKAFDTDKKNVKETPPMKEAVFANNAGVMEVFKFFSVATDEQKKQFDELVNSGNQNAALRLVEKVLGIKFQGDLVYQE